MLVNKVTSPQCGSTSEMMRSMAIKTTAEFLEWDYTLALNVPTSIETCIHAEFLVKTLARYTVSFYSSAHCLNRWLYGWSNVWSNNSSNSSSLPALALCKFSICISLYTQCPVIANILQIWFQFRQCFCFKGYSICKNHLFYWWCFCPFLNSPLNTTCQDHTCLYIFKFII